MGRKSALPVRWRAARVSDEFDPRVVGNPGQAHRPIAALDDLPTDGRGYRLAHAIKHRGRRRKAFFGALYYCALRPREAMALKGAEVADGSSPP
jgi:hypothetical protein